MMDKQDKRPNDRQRANFEHQLFDSLQRFKKLLTFPVTVVT